MRTKNVGLVVVLCIACAALGGCGSRILGGEDNRLLGKWQLKETDGIDDTVTITFSDDTISVDASNAVLNLDYGVKTSADPDQIDIRVDSASGNSEIAIASIIFNLLPLGRLKVLDGLYVFEDDDTVKMTFKPKLFGRPASIPAETGTDETAYQVTFELLRMD